LGSAPSLSQRTAGMTSATDTASPAEEQTARKKTFYVMENLIYEIELIVLEQRQFWQRLSKALKFQGYVSAVQAPKTRKFGTFGNTVSPFQLVV